MRCCDKPVGTFNNDLSKDEVDREREVLITEAQKAANQKRL